MFSIISRLSPNACTHLLDTFGLEYQQLLDAPDAVSNYEEEVLEVIKLKISEKDLWKTEMIPESALKLDYVQDFINKNCDRKQGDQDEKSADEFLNSILTRLEFHDRSIEKAPTDIYSNVVQNSKRKLSVVQERCIKSPDMLPPVKFRTAREQLVIQVEKNPGIKTIDSSTLMHGLSKRSIGTIGNRKGVVNSKYLPPISTKYNSNVAGQITSNISTSDAECDVADEHLKNIDPKMMDMILNEIMDRTKPITWNDIAGLDFAKKMVQEMVVLPMIRPDFCTRLRRPPKGLLLFGPPGTGKTLIGKVIASNSKATFFNISASSLTSKWIGEGEKMVRTLFAVAKCRQPSVIFIDEIDSLLTQRNDSEHEASRRMKTEFLVQLDGTATNEDDRILVVGATNRPQELDEAARRRLSKKLYIPLPELAARKQIINCLMTGEKFSLSEDDIADICLRTHGYSGADMTNVCKEAAYGPIRGLTFEELESMPAECVRSISHKDFLDALSQVKPSVSENDLKIYEEWNSKFGSTCHQAI